MRIIVKAKPSAREEKVELMTQPTLSLGNPKPEPDIYKVSVKEPPVDGKANEAITKALAKYFNIPILNIRLVSGQTSRRKVFDIN
ncbi:MAG: DUF167 domain-containing protein [Patescibacteria group bacterium]